MIGFSKNFNDNSTIAKKFAFPKYYYFLNLISLQFFSSRMFLLTSQNIIYSPINIKIFQPKK